MVPLLQGLREKLTLGSFPSRRPTVVSLSSSDEATEVQMKAIVEAFKLRNLAELKVILNALILSECVYKLVDIGEQASAKAVSGFTAEFPPGLVSLQHIQSANATVPHRYMLGDDGQSLYVAFMGTKYMRDLLSDANFLQEAVWKSKDPDKQQQAGALAHRGFLARARHIPVEALYAHAKSQGKSLVLCGHSLGGAVALLCALRLLQGLSGSAPSLQCICFGTPAIGNAALAAVVAEYGWESHILNFILPEDIIPRMLALPGVPRPNNTEPLPQAADVNQQQSGTLRPEAARTLASDPAVGAATVRSRLQNLRAILSASRTKCLTHEVAGSENAEANLSPAKNASGHDTRGIRSVASRLPSFRRTQSLPDSAAQSPLGQIQSGTPPDDSAQPHTGSAPANDLQELQPQVSEAQGSGMWGLQNRVQGLWLGASSRVKALKSLLPAYPAYAHIGSHQILLPASAAMSEALKAAQHQGLAEQRQQALNMHRMSAYRGRAMAICRSVLDWTSAETAPQVSPSTTLAPPITLMHSSLIIPPLPRPDILSSNQALQSPQTTVPAVLAKPRQQTPQHQLPTPAGPASRDQLVADPSQQQQSPHQPGLADRKPRFAEPAAIVATPAGPVGQQREQAAPVLAQSGQPSIHQAEPPASAQQSQPSTGAQHISASILSEASPRRWPWQRSNPSSQQSALQDTGSVAGMQGSTQASPQRIPQREVPHLSDDQAAASSSGRVAVGEATEPRPSRWLPPVGVRWQGGKQKAPPKAVIRICVQGSVHSMPVKAQLHVMGRIWCRARLLPSGMQQHGVPSSDVPVGQQSGDISWRQLLMQRLPWLRPQPVERRHAQQGVLFFQAEVPVMLLQAIVDDTARQHQGQQEKDYEQKQPPSQVLQGPQQQQVESPTEQPAMLLRLQTDFQSREQAVQVQLPVVWLLGTDPLASQAVWQMLTATRQASNSHGTATHSSLPGDAKASSAWQSAQHRFKKAVSMVRWQHSPEQLQSPQPQLEIAVVSGVRYAHIQATRMQSVDMLSCLLLLLDQFTRDSMGGAPMQQLEGSLQRLPARLRAVYHRQELQHMHSQLQESGPPSGVLIAHGGSVDLKLSHAIGLLMKQAYVMGTMRLGVTISRGAHIGSEGLFTIPSDDWVELPHHGISAPSETHVKRLQQRLQASLTAVVSGLSTTSSKL